MTVLFFLVAQGLIPEPLFDLVSTGSPNAALLGGSLSASVALTKGGILGFGGNFGVEFLKSTTGPYGASYTYYGGHLSFFGVDSVSFSASIYTGLVYGIASATDYEANFRSLTVPLKSLPQNFERQMLDDIYKLVASGAVPFGSLISASGFQRSQLKAFENYASKIRNVVASSGELNVTAFWDPADFYPAGFSIGLSGGKGDEGSVQIGFTFYTLRSGNVPFI